MREAGLAEKIDAHHHLWRYSAAEYGWIDDSMAVIRRSFLPEDLVVEMADTGVKGAVAVQARQTLEETRWLLELAEGCEAIRGVVGWVPLASPELQVALQEFSGRAKLKGLRHVIQAEEDENYILRSDFNQGIRALEGSGLVYDILIYERHLPQTIQFVDAHPRQVFVLDHIAKPRIREGILEPWASQIKDLARRENVWCKVSGLVTEADWMRWTPDGLRPYLDVVVEAFGPGRLMVGSDWPVCLVACGYRQWFELLREYFAGFSEAERDKVFGLTATDVYGLR
jgi:L-fuconolactonase